MQYVWVAHLPLIKQAEADGVLPHADKAPRAIYGVQDPMLTLQVEIAVLKVGQPLQTKLQARFKPRSGGGTHPG